MSVEPKRWQTRIWIGDKMDQPVTLYGESLAVLREVVKGWITENKPLLFGNVPPSYKTRRRVNYIYFDGTGKPPFRYAVDFEGKSLAHAGWYEISGDDRNLPSGTSDFDKVVTHFIKEAMIVEKGPEYQESVVEGGFQLHLVKTIKRESDEDEANEMLRIGWYIIGLEYQGSSDEHGIMVYRKAIFVLGHPEENAS